MNERMNENSKLSDSLKKKYERAFLKINSWKFIFKTFSFSEKKKKKITNIIFSSI